MRMVLNPASPSIVSNSDLCVPPAVGNSVKSTLTQSMECCFCW